MIFKSIKYLGMFLIFTFSAISIFVALNIRDITSPSLKRLTNYTSFFEDRFYDYRMGLTLDPKYVDKRIVLAAIDDQSLEKIGRWPWSRSTWGEVMRKLKLYGAKVVGFDVFFSEPEVACNAESPDKVLAASILDFQSIPENRVILPYSMDPDGSNAFEELPDVLYNFMLNTKQREGFNLKRQFIGKTVFPIEELQNTDAFLAHIEAEKDPDGIFRHYPVVSNTEDLYFPSFALATYQLITGDSPVLEMLGPGQADLKLKTGTLSLNYNGESKIRWVGGMSQFPLESLYDVVQASDEDPRMHQVFKDSVVYIGSISFGAHDFRHTPIDSQLPGIYYHMNMLNMLLEGRFFKPQSDSTLYSWLILVGGTLFIVIVMMFGNAIVDLLALVLTLGGIFYLDTYVLLPRGYEIKLFFCLFSPVACYSWSTFLNFYITTKEKAKIKGTFSRYVSPAVVEEMTTNPDKVRVGGERKNITVFFSDVRDFTTISEKLTPEELSKCLNQYMGRMTDILFKHQGTLDKYIGDAIVAFWGAPIAIPNHAYHAVKAALAMIEELPLVNQSFKEQGFPLFKHGIGLNTGDCSVGNMGSETLFQYTALGDNMNLGARLESLCKYYGVQLNISEYTLNAIPSELRAEFKYRILDKVRVKGKENALTIYEIFHPSHPLIDDVQAQKDYDLAWRCYQEARFREAVDLLTPLHEKYPDDKTFQRVLEFAEGYLKMPPPPDWDGVFTHTSKG